MAKSWEEYQAAGNITSVVRKKEEKKQRRDREREKGGGILVLRFLLFFLLIQSGTPPHRVMLFTFMVDQPTLVNLIWKLSHRLA